MPTENPLLLKEKYLRRKLRQNQSKVEFLAYDGEGWNGKYTLLANSKNYIFNSNGLSTLECLAFLSKRENARHRIFFWFSYDINLICADLPEDDLIILFRGGKVVYGPYTLSYIPRKIFRIRLKGRTYSYYDTGSFYMSSLINAAKKSEISIPEIITKGKAARATTLENWGISDLVEYNRQECVLLEKLLLRLQSALQLEVNSVPLEPKSYYGPGAVANVMMKSLHFKRYTYVESMLPLKIQDIINSSFIGARIEALKLGTFENVYSYDIRSAYPYQIANLPEISLKWEYTLNPDLDTIEKNPFSVWFVEWDFPKGYRSLPGGLPLRDKDGYIYFPSNGKGWYYGEELAVAVNAFDDQNFEVSKGYIMHNRGNYPFKDSIEHLYALRSEMVQNGDFRQMALKLSLNSIYGKLIQGIGNRFFRSVFYAGLITSQTRAKLLKATFGHMADIISFQTDGIKSLSPLSVEIGNGLGQWEMERLDKFQILGAGIYQYWKDERNYKHCRGYNLRNFDFDSVCQDCLQNGFSDIPTTVFVGNLLAILQKEANSHNRNKFVEITRSFNPMQLTELNDNPKKREYNFFGYPDFIKEQYHSKMYTFPDIITSYPYGTFKKVETDEETDKSFLENEINITID